MRRLISVLLAMLLAFSLVLPAAAETATTVNADEVTWSMLEDIDGDNGDVLGDTMDTVDDDSSDAVSLQDLVAFMLLLSGMKESQLGNFPYDWNCMAESAGLLDGIDYSNPDAEATTADVATMLENVQPLYDAMHAEKKQPLFIDGVAQPIFEYTTGEVEEGYSNEDSAIIRYFVYVETNHDTDGDGKLDLVKALVQVPRCAVEGDYQAATIYEARPYITGCTDLWGYDKNLYNENGYDISKMYDQPEARVAAGTATTMEAAANADSSEWYYYNPYEDMMDYEDLNWYDYYLVRGFAVVECGGLGTLGSEGFETCGTDLEIDAFKCVIEWLHGDRVAYTDASSNIQIAADWSNGNVGMTGRSYAGTTQFGLATTGVEGLKTIVPVAGIASWYEYTNSQGISTNSNPAYSDMLAGYCAGRKLDAEDWNSIVPTYGAYLGQIYNDQLALNGDYGEHWAVRDYTLNAANIACPALIVHGLNDENVRTKEFDLMYQAYQTAGVDCKLLLHQNGHLTPTYPAGGTEAYIGDELYDSILNKWFSHYLYGVNNGIESMAAVTVQDNVDGSWDTYDSWEAAYSMILGADEDAEATTTITSDGMSSRNWTIGTYTANATKWSTLYTQDIEEDTTIEGAVAVHVRAATDASQAKVSDALKMSAYLIDVSDEAFMCYNRSGNYLPQTVISAAADGEGAWMGGGLKNFDLVQYNQTSAKTKIIAKGWMDLCNPEAGYDSASAVRSARVDVNGETFYDYTLYLQPTLYTVQAGHRLALVIFTDTSNRNYGVYTITVDNANTYADIPVVNGTPVTPDPVDPVFTDVAEGAYYYDAVMWGVENGIVNGTSETTFSPNNAANRAMMTTMLHRFMGEPEASVTETAFTDIDTEDYYYNALLWANGEGIVKGTSATTFSPKQNVTRAQVVTMLYRLAGEPAVNSSAAFTDVAANAYYANAVAWAVANGITNGMTTTTFAPNAQCTRGQLITFIYRYASLASADVAAAA